MPQPAENPRPAPASAPAPASDTERLAAVQRLIDAGEPDRAEFELQRWCDATEADDVPTLSAAATFPAAARVLLAALLARRGHHLRARVVLGDPHRRDTHDMTADEGALAASLLVAAGLDHEGRRLAAWLQHLHGHRPDVARFVQLLDLPGLRQLPPADRDHARTLADELFATAHVIPSLVYAQKQRPQTRTLSLLRSALTRVVYRLENTAHFAPALQGLAELAELVGDDQDALRWAHRGLQADPYNASLALLLGRIEDDEAVGPRASQVLERVALRFPGYPDVRRALRDRQTLDRQREVA